MGKKRAIIIFLFIILLGLTPAGTSLAAPNSVNYQGILNDSAGNPVPDQAYSMVFRIYDAATAGTLLYAESQSVSTVNGIYNALLGTGTVTVGTFDPALFSADNRWLEVTVNGETLTPRQTVTSVAFSLQAEEAAHAAAADNAAALAGQPASTYDQSAHVTDTGNPHNVTAAQVGPMSGAEIENLFAKHAGEPSAHHAKTTSFTELTGQIADAQVPAEIARDTELTWNNLAGKPAGFADGVDNDSGGDITGVTAGTGLNGGGTSGNATLNVNVPLTLNGNQPLGGILSGTNSNIAGYGIYGSATATGTAVNYGGYFESNGGSGAGVFATAPDGIGVKGTSTNGTAGYFSSANGYGLIVGSGNVGIGTTSPTEKLEVQGNLKVNGNISWPAKTGYLSIPTSAFVVDRDTVVVSALQPNYKNTGISLTCKTNVHFTAPVFLPDGAHINKITTYWKDNSSKDASFSLLYSSLQGYGFQVAYGQTLWNDTLVHPITDSTISAPGPLVDNAKYGIFIDVSFHIITSPESIVFYGARIEYTYTGN